MEEACLGRQASLFIFLMKTYLIFFLLLFSQLQAFAQFAPPVGQDGSTAMYKDSSAFKAWATGCTVTRGLQDISDSALGYTTVGDSSMVLGMAGSNGVVSLGDGGTATVTFANSVMNGLGYDFAVFENGFDDYFLELAFVEVSSDGIDFFRFPATSLSDTLVQKTNADSTDATKVNNLAGKYRALYGTPFDLEELKDKTGLNVNSITHIRIVDVVGSLNDAYARFDQYGNKINDPWNTPFPSGGFDLDAVGVINSTQTGLNERSSETVFNVYPNPVKRGNNFKIEPAIAGNYQVAIYDFTGSLVYDQIIKDFTGILNMPEFKAGVYLLQITSEKVNLQKRLIVIE